MAEPLLEDDASMTACFYPHHGTAPQVASVGRIPRPPRPGAGQLLVKVHCASLNPADWKSAEGGQKALLSFDWPRVYGFDFSGTVAEVGSDDTPTPDGKVSPAPGTGGFQPGDNVFGMIRGLPQRDRGTLAEFVLVDADICALCPPDVSHQDCASVPLVGITAVKMLRSCGLSPVDHVESGVGPRVLVTGGAGGVGSIAIQLAKAMFGASFVATTASPGAKTELCRGLGADVVVNYRETTVDAALASSQEADLFDAVLDCTGEATRCVSLVKSGGGLCSILVGATIDCLRTWMDEARLDPSVVTCCVYPFLRSNIGGWFVEAGGGRSLTQACRRRGCTYAHVIGTGNGAIMREIAQLMAAGRVRAVIDRQFTLSNAVDALEYQKDGHAAGKVVVNILES